MLSIVDYRCGHLIVDIENSISSLVCRTALLPVTDSRILLDQRPFAALSQVNTEHIEAAFIRYDHDLRRIGAHCNHAAELARCGARA